MRPFLPFARAEKIAFLAAGMALIAHAGAAKAAEPHYRATLAAPVVQTRIVAKELLWSCSGPACIAGQSGSRPQIVCGALARKVGRLESFQVGHEALSASDLEACNRSAR